MSVKSQATPITLMLKAGIRYTDPKEEEKLKRRREAAYRYLALRLYESPRCRLAGLEIRAHWRRRVR